MTNNRLHDPFHIAINIAIPEPENRVSLRYKKRIAFPIQSQHGIASMLTAVRLDDQPISETYEIDDISANGRLPTKVETPRAQNAKPHP